MAVAGDGTVTVVWTNESPPRFLQSRTLPAGEPTHPVEVTSFFTDPNPLPVQLAVDAAGTATAVWVDSGRVRAGTRTPGGAWPAVTLSTEGSSAREPDVATDASGHATARPGRGPTD